MREILELDKKHGVRATINFALDVPTPRVKGASTGYQPQHKFKWDESQNSGVHEYGDDELHYAGETLKATIWFPFWEFYEGRISVDDRFEILEGPRLVGRGVVEAIIKNE
jgi:hypothetical protein